MKNQTSLCPSFRCTETSRLLGVRQDGKVAILPNPLELDQVFIQNLKNGSPPEQRFRFVNQCRMNACKQWSGTACGVAKLIIRFVEAVPDSAIPDCSIRKNCRWHQQEGPSICKVCPYIITDVDAFELSNFFKPR